MYNGIGLRTARGSGTNGYVQTNLSHLRARAPRVDYDADSERAERLLAPRKANPEILKHERKRAIEVECVKLQLKLEEKGIDEESIEDEVHALRERLTKELEQSEAKMAGTGAGPNSHQQREVKELENSRLAAALGIRQESHQPGAAFDPAIAEQRRQERQADRDRRAQELAEKAAAVERKRLLAVLAVVAEEVEQELRPNTDLAQAEREVNMKWEVVGEEAKTALRELRGIPPSGASGDKRWKGDEYGRGSNQTGDSYRPARRSSRSPDSARVRERETERDRARDHDRERERDRDRDNSYRPSYGDRDRKSPRGRSRSRSFSRSPPRSFRRRSRSQDRELRQYRPLSRTRSRSPGRGLIQRDFAHNARARQRTPSPRDERRDSPSIGEARRPRTDAETKSRSRSNSREARTGGPGKKSAAENQEGQEEGAWSDHEGPRGRSRERRHSRSSSVASSRSLRSSSRSLSRSPSPE